MNNKNQLPAFPGILQKKDSDHLNRLLEASAELSNKKPIKSIVPPVKSNPTSVMKTTQVPVNVSVQDTDLPPPIPNDDAYVDYTKEEQSKHKSLNIKSIPTPKLPQISNKKDDFDFSEELDKVNKKEIKEKNPITSKTKSKVVVKENKSSSSHLSKINLFLILLLFGASGYMYVENLKATQKISALQIQVNNNEASYNTTKSNVNFLMNKTRLDQEGKEISK